jgi:hypothetical protein
MSTKEKHPNKDCTDEIPVSLQNHNILEGKISCKTENIKKNKVHNRNQEAKLMMSQHMTGYLPLQHD